MVEDKYVGLALAILSTMAIGTSFVITKKGLLEASERHGFEGDGFAYLRSPTWWGTSHGKPTPTINLSHRLTLPIERKGVDPREIGPFW